MSSKFSQGSMTSLMTKSLQVYYWIPTLKLCHLFIVITFQNDCVCSTKTLIKLPKVIGEQIVSPFLVADSLIHATHNRSTIFARWRQCACPIPWAHSLTISNGSSFNPSLHGQATFSLCVTLCYTISPKLSLFLWRI